MEHNPFLLWQIFVPVLILAIVIVAFLERSRRERHRLELQKAILERVGSVKDLAEFLTTEQGQRFLGALAPAHFRPHHRGLWSVRIGIVLVTVGLFVMIALHSLPLGGDPPPPLLILVLMLIAVGAGMLLSAAVSFVIARRLGLNGHGSSKGDAV